MRLMRRGVWRPVFIAVLLTLSAAGGVLLWRWRAPGGEPKALAAAAAIKGAEAGGVIGRAAAWAEGTAWAPAQGSEEARPSPRAGAEPSPSSENCIRCHTNKALLQALAEEPQELKSELASGEG